LNQQTPSGSTAPQSDVTFNTQVVTPGNEQLSEPLPEPTSAEEAAVLEKLHEQERRENVVNPYSHWHNISPISDQQNPGQTQPQTAQRQGPNAQGGDWEWETMPTQAQPGVNATQTAANPQPQQQVTQAPDPAILQLASNDDLNVATIAREANKRKEELQDEVVISLH
jgi:hypothetical protein